ncbi:phytanoyl-CoA dioxygenase family protein [Phenylobacterium sp.]|uniref:phytanoyl-CoA dioxygenase family protein n=1 Tax=Phenylobacterium sp. TaxID=1871053 RepID=UPI0035B2391E
MQASSAYTPSRGYALLPQALDAAELAGIEAALAELMAFADARLRGSDQPWPGPQEAPIVVAERSDPLKVCRVEHLVGSSPAFARLAAERLRPWAEAAAGQPMALFKDKCNLKQPGGGAFRPHQDITAYKGFGPAFHLTVAIVLDDATVENGCLEFAPHYLEELSTPREAGEPGRALDAYEGGPRNGDVVDELAERLTWESTPARRGDVVLFDSYVPHRSDVNATGSTRRMFFFTFNPLAEGDHYARYYAMKRSEPDNPIFHVSTPTAHASLAAVSE